MTIIFYLKKAKNPTPTSLIMMKVYHHQLLYGVCICSTKERIAQKDWNQPEKKKGAKLETGWPKKGHESLEARLLQIKRQAIDFIRDNPQKVTRETLKQHLKGQAPRELPVEKPKTLLEEWKGYLDRNENNVAPSTHYCYRSSYDVMEAFLKQVKQVNILPINFDIKTYHMYRNYLNERYPSGNSVAKRIRHFKMMLNQGIKLGMDINEVKYRETPGLKISLSEEELGDLIKLQFDTEHLRRIRDMFIVQCHTGVRVSDLFRLDKNIKGNCFEFKQAKTDKPVRIPILPIVKEILERYNYKLPKLSDQKYNDGIKLVYKALNERASIQVREDGEFKNVPVWKLISSHDAVRTFITISAERGVPVPSIARITGKTVNILLRNYLVDSQKVAEREMLEKWRIAPVQTTLAA